MMRQGGNDQIRRFFRKLEIENSPIQLLYCTKGAQHYRERLKERVDKILSGEIVYEKRVVVSTHSQSAKQDRPPRGGSNGGDHAVIDTLTIVFKEGPMGLTLTKDHKEMAVVSKLVPGGPAQSSGVRVGDYVAGVSGRSVERYDEIMQMVPHLPRPITIKFSRCMQQVPKLNAQSLLGHFHGSRSEPSLFKSAQADSVMENLTGESTSNESRTNSRDSNSGGTVSISRSGTKTLDDPPITPRMKMRSDAKASPRCGSLSDGEEGGALSAMNKTRPSPRSRSRKELEGLPPKTPGGGREVLNLTTQFAGATIEPVTSIADRQQSTPPPFILEVSIAQDLIVISDLTLSPAPS